MEWVEANFKASQLEEDRKPYLASLMNEFAGKTTEKIAESKLERMALGTPEYRKYITGMCAARADAERAKVEYEATLNWFEARRSEMALERSKIEKGIFLKKNLAYRIFIG